MTTADATTPKTAYDEVPYVSGARHASSIDRLATIGALLGLRVAPPERCRVLELGSGDGGNLIPMAVSFPGSEFLGIDLAPTAIARGMEAIAACGLTNIRLQEGSFASAGPGLGQFDYVIAHGVYSWVPEEARAELLDAIRDRLAPHGIAFVSYNAQPGAHVRGILREMMLLHTRHVSDPKMKIQQARALLALLARAPAEAGDIYRPILQSEVGKALQSSDFMIYHDDLAPIAEPFFFSDFMAAANRHGLQFAAEANFYQMSVDILEPDVAAQLAELSMHDLIAKEQYLDFLTCRSFRQTLLCHEGLELDRSVDVEKVSKFRFSTDASVVDDEEGAAGTGFKAPNGAKLRTDNPASIAALHALVAANPRSIAFKPLAELAGATSDEDLELLAEMLYRAFSAGVIDFNISEPAAVFELSERPNASPWARYRADRGHVVNLYHETIGIDAFAASLLERLDGTRTLAQLAAELGSEESKVAAEAAELAAKGLLVG